jgi:hypothetical protein
MVSVVVVYYDHCRLWWWQMRLLAMVAFEYLSLSIVDFLPFSYKFPFVLALVQLHIERCCLSAYRRLLAHVLRDDLIVETCLCDDR